MFIPGGIVLILQIALAVHVIRTGRPWYWIMLIVFLPLLGIAVYVIVELLPEWTGGYRARRTFAAVGQALTPGRDYRRWAEAVEATPTAGNMMHLAEECLALGRFDEATELYRRALVGVHADDTAMLFGLARARFGAGDAAEARQTLERLKAMPGYESPEAHLLYARSLEAAGELDAAHQEYESASRTYPGPEAACRHALLLQKMGRSAEAEAIFADIKKSLDRSPGHVRRINREWYDLARRGGAA
jgi:hypothetical protein